MRADKFAARRVALRAARPQLKREAAARLLDLYRRDRKLARGPLTALIGQRALFNIIARGEFEHRLRIARPILRLREFAGLAFTSLRRQK